MPTVLSSFYPSHQGHQRSHQHHYFLLFCFVKEWGGRAGCQQHPPASWVQSQFLKHPLPWRAPFQDLWWIELITKEFEPATNVPCHYHPQLQPILNHCLPALRIKSPLWGEHSCSSVADLPPSGHQLLTNFLSLFFSFFHWKKKKK